MEEKAKARAEIHAIEKQYYKPNFGPEETEQDVMATTNASRARV